MEPHERVNRLQPPIHFNGTAPSNLSPPTSRDRTSTPYVPSGPFAPMPSQPSPRLVPYGSPYESQAATPRTVNNELNIFNVPSARERGQPYTNFRPPPSPSPSLHPALSPSMSQAGPYQGIGHKRNLSIEDQNGQEETPFNGPPPKKRVTYAESVTSLSPGAAPPRFQFYPHQAQHYTPHQHPQSPYSFTSSTGLRAPHFVNSPNGAHHQRRLSAEASRQGVSRIDLSNFHGIDQNPCPFDVPHWGAPGVAPNYANYMSKFRDGLSERHGVVSVPGALIMLPGATTPKKDDGTAPIGMDELNKLLGEQEKERTNRHAGHQELSGANNGSIGHPARQPGIRNPSSNPNAMVPGLLHEQQNMYGQQDLSRAGDGGVGHALRQTGVQNPILSSMRPGVLPEQEKMTKSAGYQESTRPSNGRTGYQLGHTVNQNLSASLNPMAPSPLSEQDHMTRYAGYQELNRPSNGGVGYSLGHPGNRNMSPNLNRMGPGLLLEQERMKTNVGYQELNVPSNGRAGYPLGHPGNRNMSPNMNPMEHGLLLEQERVRKNAEQREQKVNRGGYRGGGPSHSTQQLGEQMVQSVGGRGTVPPDPTQMQQPGRYFPSPTKSELLARQEMEKQKAIQKEQSMRSVERTQTGGNAAHPPQQLGSFHPMLPPKVPAMHPPKHPSMLPPKLPPNLPMRGPLTAPSPATRPKSMTPTPSLPPNIHKDGTINPADLILHGTYIQSPQKPLAGVNTTSSIASNAQGTNRVRQTASNKDNTKQTSMGPPSSRNGLQGNGASSGPSHTPVPNPAPIATAEKPKTNTTVLPPPSALHHALPQAITDIPHRNPFLAITTETTPYGIVWPPTEAIVEEDGGRRAPDITRNEVTEEWVQLQHQMWLGHMMYGRYATEDFDEATNGRWGGMRRKGTRGTERA